MPEAEASSPADPCWRTARGCSRWVCGVARLAVLFAFERLAHRFVDRERGPYSAGGLTGGAALSSRMLSWKLHSSGVFWTALGLSEEGGLTDSQLTALTPT